MVLILKRYLWSVSFQFRPILWTNDMLFSIGTRAACWRNRKLLISHGTPSLLLLLFTELRQIDWIGNPVIVTVETTKWSHFRTSPKTSPQKTQISNQNQMACSVTQLSRDVSANIHANNRRQRSTVLFNKENWAGSTWTVGLGLNRI